VESCTLGFSRREGLSQMLEEYKEELEAMQSEIGEGLETVQCEIDELKRD